MNQEKRQAYEWAKNQDWQSVAAKYAKILAGLVDEMTPPNEPLTCAGCIYLDQMPAPYANCVRAKRTMDYYRRPPEGEEGNG